MSTHEDYCKVCQSGVSVDLSISNAELSRQLDVSKDSVSRHRKWVGTQGQSTTSDSVEWIAVKKWDSGDQVRYSYRRADTDAETLLDDKRIDSLIKAWPMHKRLDKTGLPEFACPADLQLGKSERGIGTDDTIAKFVSSIEHVADRWEILKPTEGYLCDMGDLIENLFSVGSQVSTNDRSVPKQIEDAVAIYMNAIGRLLPLTGKLFFVTVTSNHGEARNNFKSNPYDSENDWGLHILNLLKDRCEDRGWDVTFVRPDMYEDTAVVTTSEGTTVALTHGHHSGTPTAMEKWVTNQIVGKCPGWDADIWVHGHYHNATHFSVGQEIDVFGTPSLDPGSAWFQKKSGKRARQGIVAFTVDKGDWSNYSIL